MRFKWFAPVVAIALVVGVSGVAMAQGKPWIHVQVVEDGGDGTKVNVNLLLSLIEVALDIAAREGFKHHDEMDFDFDHGDFSIDDMRRIWSELRDAGDAEFVEVQDDGDHIRIFREGDTVYVHVDEDADEEGEAGEKVRVEIPFAIVDTLLEGEGNELNIEGAIRQLAETARGDIVTVHDGDTVVRVWIDERG